MTKFEFQSKAIEEFCTSFKMLWRANGSKLPLVFKSPTGSGKTFMVTSFINDLSAVENFDEDVAWIWITFSDELAMQSRDKFNEYFYPNSGRRLLTVSDFSEGKLRKNDVLFINWQKLVAKSAASRVLRRPDDENLKKESGYYYEDLVEATHAEGRKIALVIDESHKNVTESAIRDVIEPMNPKVIVKVSATPKPEDIPNGLDLNDHRAGLVVVKRADVVAAGLIKEAIVSQTKEELEKGSTEEDMDNRLLDLAMQKRAALKELWEKAGQKVNPLVLIQLPNDDSELKALKVPTKEEIVLGFLKRKGIPEDKIACWFDDKRTPNLDGITENDNPVEFLLFKYAAGTGWDCPRAQVLAMFREIKTPIFKTQTLGRILRNPVPRVDLSAWQDLRLGYLYTNYARNEIEEEAGRGNDPVLTRHAELIPALAEEIGRTQDGYVIHPNMLSEFVSRADYGDLGKASAFQASLIKSMDDHFGLTKDDLMSQRTEKLKTNGIDFDGKLTNKLIASVKWEGDDFSHVDGGEDVDHEVSANDSERWFTRACTSLLKEQTELDAKVTNIARSAGVFRGALREWLRESMPDVASETARYRVFLKDLCREASSVLRPAITAALKAYAPIKKKFVEARRKREEERKPELFTLKRAYAFSDKCSEYGEAKLSAVQPFYLSEDYDGRDNEVAFIKYLEQQGDHIDWWFKNGSEGKDAFALKYFNTTEKDTRLFYPDWIIKFKDGRIGIFDTKSGRTASDPEGREKGLHEKIVAMNAAAGKDVYVGGLVVMENEQWYWNEGVNYKYSKGKLDDEWKLLKTIFA